MKSHDLPELWPSPWPANLEGAFAGALPSYSLDSVLEDLRRELAPRRWLPPLAGADIITDIWNAVKRLVSFPMEMAGWMWDRYHSLYNRAWDVLVWFWDQKIDPFFRWTWGVTDTFAHWVWNLVEPKLNWIAAKFDEWSHWLWYLVEPKLLWVARRVEDWARWGWDLVQPKFLWTWGVTETFAHWLWDLVEPKFIWTWGVVDTWAHWLWDQVDPVLNFIWTDIIKRTDDVILNVVNEAQSLGETVINTGIQGAQAIGGGFQDALRWLFEHVFDPFADSVGAKLGIPRKLATGQYKTVEELLDDFEDPFPLGSMAGFLLSLVGAVVGLVPALMDVGRIQFQETTQKIAQAIGLTIPTFADLRDALLRDLMDEETHDDWLGRAGFSQTNIDIVKELYWDVPTPSDLVRMAVREAFTPDVVERFGLHEDFPPDFEKYGKQTGISAFWAKAHWAAHWQLPSATQGFQMLHRDVIELTDLELLLRTQDVMPFWRDKLVEIAYRVISRVDVRRMYRHGVIDRDKVLRVYLDLGYTAEDAEALTQFVEASGAGVDKDVPRETIVGAYRDRLLDRAQAEADLGALGFRQEAIDLFLELADFAVEKQNAVLAEDIVEADFKAGAVSEAAARAQLVELGIPPARIELLIGLWSRKAAVRTLTLSGSQLLRLHREGLMPEATLRERLDVLGYNETDVDYLVQLAPPEPPAEPRTLSQAQIRAALREGVIDVAEFTSRLEGLGYPPEDIAILLDLEQPDELVKVKALTVSQLQRAFRQGLIDEAKLREGLAERGYTPAGVDVLVELAQPEVAVRVRELTVSQLQRAFRQGLIDAADLQSRLLELGYNAEAAALLVDLARPPEDAPPRELSVTQLQRALRGELLTEAEVQVQLIGLGYSAGAVSVIIALARPEELVLERDLTVAQDQRAFREGLLLEEELRRRLTAMGFAALDVDILVELARPKVS